MPATEQANTLMRAQERYRNSKDHFNIFKDALKNLLDSDKYKNIFGIQEIKDDKDWITFSFLDRIFIVDMTFTLKDTTSTESFTIQLYEVENSIENTFSTENTQRTLKPLKNGTIRVDVHSNMRFSWNSTEQSYSNSALSSTNVNGLKTDIAVWLIKSLHDHLFGS